MTIEDWAQRIINSLDAHITNERGALADYRRLAVDEPDERVRFIAELIFQDERRHHQLLSRMIDTLRAEVGGRATGNSMPLEVVERSRRKRQIETSRLIALEREDLRELKQLRKEIAKVSDTSWWVLVIDMMIADNRKHIVMLRHLRSA